jgi:hypothetical protein
VNYQKRVLNEYFSYFRFMVYKTLIVPFLLLLLLASCKKGKGEFLLKGTITDQTFNQPLSGATVKLYQVPVGTTQLILIGTQTLNSEGAYEFTFSRDKMEKYILRVVKTNYFDLEKVIYFSTLTLKEDNVRNYSTTAKSWVKIHLLNQSPLPQDQLIYIKQQGKIGCLECCQADTQYFQGALDTTFYCINDGNTTYSFLYGISGTSVSEIVGAVTVPFDTTEIYVPY